jgi:hypothetical protein
MNNFGFNYEYSSMLKFTDVNPAYYGGSEVVVNEGWLANAAHVMTLINATPSVNVTYGLPKNLSLTTAVLRFPFKRHVTVREDEVLRRAALRSTKIIAKGRFVSK